MCSRKHRQRDRGNPPRRRSRGGGICRCGHPQRGLLRARRLIELRLMRGVRQERVGLTRSARGRGLERMCCSVTRVSRYHLCLPLLPECVGQDWLYVVADRQGGTGLGRHGHCVRRKVRLPEMILRVRPVDARCRFPFLAVGFPPHGCGFPEYATTGLHRRKRHRLPEVNERPQHLLFPLPQNVGRRKTRPSLHSGCHRARAVASIADRRKSLLRAGRGCRRCS